MKKFLLAIAAFATVTGLSAQQTYNYFDAADVDADGWIWFDTQEKLEKYVGFANPFGVNPKIMLLTDDIMDSYAEPQLDANIQGYDADGVEGGPDSRKGGIVLPPATDMLGVNGGGFAMWLPDLAEFSVSMSSSDRLRNMVLAGGKGELERVDYGRIEVFMPPFLQLTTKCQYNWNNLQNVGKKEDLKLKSEKGEKVTAAIISSVASPVIIHGMKVMTYTKTSDSSAGIDDVIDGSALQLSFNGKDVYATENAAISVYSVAGSKVAEVNGASVSLENLAPGAYVVKAVSGNGAATIKVVR